MQRRFNVDTYVHRGPSGPLSFHCMGILRHPLAQVTSNQVLPQAAVKKQLGLECWKIRVLEDCKAGRLDNCLDTYAYGDQDT